MPKSIIHAYDKFEKQAHRLSNKLYFHHNLPQLLDSICVKLFKSINVNLNHPLRVLFKEKKAVYYDLRRKIHLIPINKSSRVMKSFVSFYNSNLVIF